jgi:hypothetical protein
VPSLWIVPADDLIQWIIQPHALLKECQTSSSIKEPRPQSTARGGHEKGGSDPGLWAVEPPQTRFARILATGVAPALDRSEICTCSACKDHQFLKRLDKEKRTMASYITQRVKRAKQQIAVRLYEDQLAMLDGYGRYIDDNRDYIVSQALEFDPFCLQRRPMQGNSRGSPRQFGSGMLVRAPKLLGLGAGY